jgi:hypothetical protein
MAEYIEREALRDDIRESYLKLQEIYETLRYERERDICNGELGTFCEVLMRIKDFPSADVVPVVHGRLTNIDKNEWYCDFGKCSVCGEENPTDAKYCLGCGARLDGE